MTDAFDLAAMKRDMDRPRLTKDWHVVTDVPAPGWVQVIGPAFKVDGPTTATNLNGEDYMDRHRDARRIARVPEMEAEILRLRAEVDALETKLAERVTVKPLVDGPDFVRDALGDVYFVEQRDGVWGYHQPGRGGFTFGGYGLPNNSREDMLAIIQRGCERRILSSITTAPTTQIEAAKVLLDNLDVDEWRKNFVKTLRAIVQEGQS